MKVNKAETQAETGRDGISNRARINAERMTENFTEKCTMVNNQ